MTNWRFDSAAARGDRQLLRCPLCWLEGGRLAGLRNPAGFHIRGSKRKKRRKSRRNREELSEQTRQLHPVGLGRELQRGVCALAHPVSLGNRTQRTL